MSNSRNYGQGYLEHAEGVMKDFLGSVNRVLFIPFAAVRASYDDFASLVRSRFEEMGYLLDSIHESDDAKTSLLRAEAIAVGGGNTFHLLRALYEHDLIDSIRQSALAGVPYTGWSAGSNVACPTIRTTNDMPIVEPPSFDALNLVPFQINPHYTDFHPPYHQGETREERILEFIEANAGVRVVGLREGSLLRVEGDRISLLGEKSARIWVGGEEPRECDPGESLQFLLETM